MVISGLALLWVFVVINRPHHAELEEVQTDVERAESKALGQSQTPERELGPMNTVIKILPGACKKTLRESLFPKSNGSKIKYHRVRGHWRRMTHLDGRRKWIASFWKGDPGLGTIKSEYLV